MLRRDLICDSEFDGDGAWDSLAGQRSLVDDGAVRPLGGRDVVDFAAQARDIEAVLGVDFV